MKRFVFLPLIFYILFTGVLYSQDLNQSVEVTNTFRSRDLDFYKKGVDLTLPDSMSVFHSSFDYRVFANPYRGSGKFNPYRVFFQPRESSDETPFLYFSAGAGYRFAPEFSAVFSPRLKGRTRFLVTDDFNGYAGKYYSFENGHDFYNKSSASISTVIGGISVDANVDYLYYNTSYLATENSVHGASFSMNLKQLSKERESVSFDALVKASAFYDTSLDSFMEKSLSVSGTLRPRTLMDGKVAADYSAGYNDLSGINGQTYFHLSLLPHYCISYKSFALKAGFKAALIAGEFFFNPYINGSLDVIKNSTRMYWGVDGGARPISYGWYKSVNHFVNPEFLCGGNLPAYVHDKYSLFAGAQTCLFQRLSLDFKASYNNSASKALYCIYNGAPALTADSYKAVVLSGGAFLNVRNITARLMADLTKSNVNPDIAFTDPALKVQSSIEYNFMGRLQCNLSLDYTSSRECGIYVIDDIWDLSLKATYQIRQGFRVYLKGANMLCSRLEYLPGIARRGMCITGGICLEIR